MMRFGPPSRRRSGEAIVPMINVVFLLLVFFLMTAQIAPPDPFPVAPPLALAGDAQLPPDTLFVAADGRLAYEAARDEAVFGALAARTGEGPLALRADAGLPAAELARLLPRLAAAGVEEVSLVTGQP